MVCSGCVAGCFGELQAVCADARAVGNRTDKLIGRGMVCPTFSAIRSTG
jgi:hypothetical protein